MNTFPAKLAVAVVVVYLLADTSASVLPPDGDSKGSSLVFGCGGNSRKAFPGKEGTFGCEYLVISGNKKLPFWILRSVPIRSPPSPVPNRRSSMGSSPPPLQM